MDYKPLFGRRHAHNFWIELIRHPTPDELFLDGDSLAKTLVVGLISGAIIAIACRVVGWI